MLKYAPAVFITGDQYMIMVRTQEHCFLSVQIGDQAFPDAVNGVMRSCDLTHTVYVPMALLDEARHYAVTVTRVLERKTYYTQAGESKTYDYDFAPVLCGHARVFHLADTHRNQTAPIACGKAYGPIDLLILNGDVLSDCVSENDFDHVLVFTDALTGGHVPTLHVRGNHDGRGPLAEKMDALMPKVDGKTYFTFRVGDIWGVVLDCGEDKPDDHIQYGGTSCCHAFRQAQTAFLQRVIARKDAEYNAPGVRHKWVICHHPFTFKLPEPFDIELDTYAAWAKLLKEHVQPEFLLSGHLHLTAICPPGNPLDNLGQPCTLLLGSADKDGEEYHAGMGLDITPQGVKVTFIDNHGTVLHEAEISPSTPYWANRYL